jgi:hypothetical protein
MKLLTQRPLVFCLPALLLTALGLAALDHWRPRHHPPRPDLPEKWNSRDVAKQLRGTGREYRVVGVDFRGLDKASAFFTETDMTWSELNGLSKTVENIASWRGSVFCQKVGSTYLFNDQMEMWGEYCLRVGPFIFFGDAAMLAEIKESLATPVTLSTAGG